jgi:carbon storage regulator
MLVLTRKVDQGIVIAVNIYIRVLGVERDRVKIGIAAPKEIPVLRQELLDRDQAKSEANKTGKTNNTGKAHDESPPAAAKPAATVIDSNANTSSES